MIKPVRILIVDDDRATRHLLRRILVRAGFRASVAKDGTEALTRLRAQRFDLVLLDVWMPRRTGLDVLEKIEKRKVRPRVIVMTSDDAPETVLKAARRQAFTYLHKPVDPTLLLQTIRETINAKPAARIEVVSARSDWVELVVPCTREAADRIQPLMARLDADLAPGMRESIAFAFRELLLNAIEWGGRLKADRSVRVSYLRSRRMLMYRIADPGPGFNLEDLPHAAIGQPRDVPIAHMQIREDQGLRPGGFGLLMVRASVDELLYNERRNEVVFIKYLSDGSAKG
jgi:CheY-like chemotaxis protein/anti-sigma regulatory factor (Ser/Thr protein kinase)